MSSVPQFSVITPVQNPPRRALEAMLASVRRQTMGSWEHCIVDDGSTDGRVALVLEQAAKADPRVRMNRRPEQGGIVAASNDALAMATGEFVAFLDHDDELHPRALEDVAAAIDAAPDVDYVYTDEDKITVHGRHFDPFVKPDWSPDRLRCQMYTAHLSVARRSLVEEIGRLRPGFDGAQDWDLVLRVIARARRIVHVPEILYHWRAVSASAAAGPDAKPWAHQASRRAVAEHVQRSCLPAEVEPVLGFPGQYWLRPMLRDHPLVSVIVPTAGRHDETRDTGEPLVVSCLRSVVERSTYPSLEFVVVVDTDAPPGLPDQLQTIAGDRLRLVPFERPFNFSSKINAGVAASAGSYLLLLNDDIEVPPGAWRPPRQRGDWGIPAWPTVDDKGRRSWIESLVLYASQLSVGAVGAKLFFPEGAIQHAGVIARGGSVGHSCYGTSGDSAGYSGVLLCASNVLAVTGACLLTSRAAYDAAGGFDESMPVNYNDVDFCLRLREHGRRSVLLPEVELIHWESISRGRKPARPEEVEALQARWGGVLWADPYYPAAFVGSNFDLPRYTRNGEFGEPRHRYANMVRTVYQEGGLPRVVSRSAGKLYRLLRRAR